MPFPLDAPRWFVDLLVSVDTVVLWYMFLVNSFFALLLVLAVPQLFAHWRFGSEDVLTRSLTSSAVPRVSIVVPAYNEAVTIVDSLRALLTLQYPYYEVVLINDGSKDDTLARLIEAYDLYPAPPAVMRKLTTKGVRTYYRSRTWSRLLVVDKENGGKADALNVGLDAARFPFVLACDADTLIEPDALLRLARPFLFDEKIAAVGGTIRVVNGCRVEHGRVTDARVSSQWLAGMQTVEYLRAFLFGRLGWNLLGGNLIISGAFGLFRRDYLQAILGYATSTVTEDFELIVRLQRYLREHAIRAKVAFIPDPVAWTEAPESLAVLGRQRERWHRGLIATMLTHRDLILNPKHGAIGLIGMPYFLFAELIAPVVEVAGLLLTLVGTAFGLLDAQFAIVFFVVTYLYLSLMSLAAILMEDVVFHRYRRTADTARLIAFALLEPFGYHQITVWFRLKSFWKFMRGDHSWGRMTRVGFGGATAPAAGAAAAPPMPPMPPMSAAPMPVTPMPVTPMPVTPMPVTPMPVTPMPATPAPAAPSRQRGVRRRWSIGAEVDVSVDASVDVSVDAALDASVDVSVDAAVDAAVDTAIDASIDAVVVARVEVSLDVAVDVCVVDARTPVSTAAPRPVAARRGGTPRRKSPRAATAHRDATAGRARSARPTWRIPPGPRQLVTAPTALELVTAGVAPDGPAP